MQSTTTQILKSLIDELALTMPSKATAKRFRANASFLKSEKAVRACADTERSIGRKGRA